METLHFQKIPFEEKENFKIHLFNYLKELGITKPEYPYLDSYWQKKNRTPLYFYFGKRKIGFALINNYCLEQKVEPAHSIAEFYIFEKERRNHFGKKIAIQISTHSKAIGKSDDGGNKKSALFWENVIANYAPHFSKNSNHTNWQGIIYCFNNKLKSK